MNTVTQLSVLDLQKLLLSEQDLILLDVRELAEYQIARIENSLLIPLGQLSNNLTKLAREQPLAVICHHGIRSQQAAEYLAFCGFSQVYNVSGGIDAWSLQCDKSVSRY